MSHSLGHSIPEMWALRHPPVGTTVNLHIALKPHREDALINALYEASHPKHPKCVPEPLYSRAHIHTCIWFQQNAAHLSKD